MRPQRAPEPPSDGASGTKRDVEKDWENGEDGENAMALTQEPAEQARAGDRAAPGGEPVPGPGPDGRAVDEAEPPESARERVNRRWIETLQETRVAQTGVQILFGFLLSVAFTPLFRDLHTFDRVVYTVTVVLGASATAALIAPVSLHRFLSGQRMKDDVVHAAGRLMVCGMVLLSLTISGTLLLILRVVVPGLLAEFLVGCVMLWFAVCWYGLPWWLRHRSGRRTGRGGPPPSPPRGPR